MAPYFIKFATKALNHQKSPM